jgi:hypothetical protein
LAPGSGVGWTRFGYVEFEDVKYIDIALALDEQVLRRLSTARATATA